MSLPIKISLDGNRLLNKDNISNYNMNTNFSKESNAIQNEYGFLEVPDTEGLTIIGAKKIFNNQTIICSVIDNPNYKSEIGILTDGVYKTILRDNVVAGALFGFNIDNLIQIESKLTVNNEIIVYFVDGYNSDKYLNITTLQVNITNDLMIADSDELRNMIGFRLNSSVNIYLNDANTGGDLLSGEYYVMASLWNKGGVKTHSLVISNPIQVNPSSLVNDGALPGTVTNKKISVNFHINEIPVNYDYITIYCISKINQTLKAYEVGTLDVPTIDFNYEITSLDSSSEVSPDSIIINTSNYINALTITQVDDVLFKGNLKASQEIDLQGYVNNIQVDYVSKEINLNNSNEDYGNAVVSFFDKSFMYDEVYALYASFIIEDNFIEYETKAYHIPGRSPKVTIQSKLENARIDSLTTQLPYYSTTLSDCTPLKEILETNADAKIFHGLDTNGDKVTSNNMGYWENTDEKYSLENKWLVLNSDGTPNTSLPNYNFKGQNVRHHKFPTAYTRYTNGPNMISNVDGTGGQPITEVLGIKLSNIVIPDEYVGKIKKIKIYYAKRTLENRTILAQALSIPQSLRHRFAWTDGPDQSIYNPTGSFWIQDIFMNSPGFLSYPGEGFTPTNTNLRSLLFYNSSNLYNQGWFERTDGGSSIKGNYSLADQVGSNWDAHNSYISLRPFDLLLNNTSIQATHFKNLFRYIGKYIPGAYAGGSSNPSATSWWIYSYNFRTDVTFFGVDRAEFGSEISSQEYNYIRKVNFSNLVYNTTTDYQSLGFSNALWSKNVENRYVLEFPRPLFSNFGNDVGGGSDGDGNTQGQDAAIICLVDPTTLHTPVGIYGEGYASPYLTNICSFKENIYLTFDNQILCSTGFAYDIDTVESEEIYGGDTFTSYYGERSTVNLDPLFRHPTEPSLSVQTEELRTMHYYICQSTSNIKLRNSGTNSYETYFPKASVDAIPSNYNNYYGYNLDYSSLNDLSQPVINNNRLNNTLTVYPNRIIKSQVNNPELQEDNYLIFNAADTTDVGLQYGQIENLFNITNKLGIHMTNNLLLTMNKQTMETSSGKAYIGAGDIFAVKPQNVNSDFYGGVIGRYACCMTPYGYYFVDVLNYTALLFDGSTFKDVSSDGLNRFFFDYSDYNLPKQLNNLNEKFIPDWRAIPWTKDSIVKYSNSYWIALNTTSTVPSADLVNWKNYQFPVYNIRSTVGGLGYTVEYDNVYDRVLFSKRDYNITPTFVSTYSGLYRAGDSSQIGSYITYNNLLGSLSASFVSGSISLGEDGPYFLRLDYNNFESANLEFNGFTLGYYPTVDSWVSFYTYKPDLFVGSSKTLFSSKNNRLYEHNQKMSPFFYDKEEISWFVEPLYKMDFNQRLSSIQLKTEKTYFNKYSAFQGLDKNSTVFQLETFDSYFVFNKNQLSLEIPFQNAITSRDNEGYFNFNDFRDFSNGLNPTLFNFTSSSKDVNITALDVNKHWTKQRKFVDFWQGARLIKNSTEFISIGTGYISGNNLTYGNISVLTIGVVIRIKSANPDIYATIRYYAGGTSSDKYELVYLFGDSGPIDGTYSIELFNGYNLALLDTTANAYKNFR